MLDTTYLLPIKAATPPDQELTDYLALVSTWCRILVVDGSSPDVFAAADEAWSSFAVHVGPDPELTCINGKVAGVLTGLRLVETPTLVIADDDVRYTLGVLTECVNTLDRADLVRPQNYFDPMPWHARWDTARTLLNRRTGGDFPGTLAVRTDRLRATGGYDGDVLFENLELMRTIEAGGGTCRSRPDLFVRRLPPTTPHFVRQRVRQAYDEFSRPLRLLVWLSVVPAVVLAAVRRRPALITAAALASVAVAESGRRTDGGRQVFPASSSLLAPLWIGERGICSWLAVGARLRGGVTYAGRRVHRAASSAAELRRRLRPR